MCQPISTSGAFSRTIGLRPQYPRKSEVESDSTNQIPNSCASYTARFRVIHADASSLVLTRG
jgi:hypothetical protein